VPLGEHPGVVAFRAHSPKLDSKLKNSLVTLHPTNWTRYAHSGNVRPMWVERWAAKCGVCGHEWLPENVEAKGDPKRCARCRTRKWNQASEVRDVSEVHAVDGRQDVSESRGQGFVRDGVVEAEREASARKLGKSGSEKPLNQPGFPVSKIEFREVAKRLKPSEVLRGWRETK